jgi:glycosyltransferase involved in cell wall biosynthesis
MPAYNAQQTIGEAVAAALAQTMAELEVIVVDDGSARPVTGALEAVRDERVRILRSVANRGVSAARNSALAAARAPLVAQLDADDLWEKTHLEGMLRALDDPSVGLAYANAEVIGHPRGARLWIPSRDWGEPSVQGAGVSHPVNELETLYRGNPIPAPTVVMRTQAARAAGGYPRWLKVGEDYMLYIRLMQAGWRFAFVDRTSAVYRWPEPGRGATFDRRRNARQQLKLLLALIAEAPRESVLRTQLSRHLAEIVRTHVPGSVWIARTVRRMLSVGPRPADKI